MSSQQPSIAVPASPARVLMALISRFVLISALFLIGWTLYRATSTPDPTGHMLAWVNGLVPITDIASLALIAWLLRVEGRSLRDIIGSRVTAGLRPSAGREALACLAVTLIFLVTFVAASFIANLIVYRGAPPAYVGTYQPPVPALLLQLLLPLTTGVAEEVVYRGYAIPRLTTLLGGRAWLAVVVQAFFFGLQHVAFFWGDLGPGAVSKFVAMFLGGLVFGLIYTRQRRLLPLIVAHIVVDAVGFWPSAIIGLTS